MIVDLPFPNKGPWSAEEVAQLRVLYSEGQATKAIAAAIGRSPGAVRNQASEIGVAARLEWTREQIAELQHVYSQAEFAEDLDLEALAKRLGKTKAAVAVRASRLGLTSGSRSTRAGRKDRRKFKGDAAALKADISQRSKRIIAENGHPRGFKGGKHTAQTRQTISDKSKAAWAGKTQQERDQWVDKLVAAQKGPPKIARGTWKAGWREIGGKRNYYRSRWEANYARYLEWLKVNGQIADWRHEPETFWFEAIKRGVRSYKPDFRVWETSGQSCLHEVKGWMDARSKTTLKRMAKYHPAQTIIVVREKQYKEIARKVAALIPDWEIGARSDVGGRISFHITDTQAMGMD